MIRWRMHLGPRMYLTWLTGHEYRRRAQRALRRLQLPYFLPHVWQAMLLAAFGVGGAIGVGLALWTLATRGLLYVR